MVFVEGLFGFDMLLGCMSGFQTPVQKPNPVRLEITASFFGTNAINC